MSAAEQTMRCEFSTAGRILYGQGALDELGRLVQGLGSRVLLVLGGRSADEQGLTERLHRLLPVAAVAHCRREPAPEDVAGAVAIGREARCDVVVAAGGGSVLDCGKAASAMLTNPGALEDYLEGVGRGLVIEQPPLPMLAVPTTAGTGSEVTKNAVISGPGYKKSVRSPLLIPRVALVDPLLSVGLPPMVTAACGMDALTQLIEAYLSKNASPITDALALQGIAAVGRSLERAYSEPQAIEAREDMALGSLLGGMCLANAGLGAVHGLASPLGALLPIPHGVACAALLPQVLRMNVEVARGTSLEERVSSRCSRVAASLLGVADAPLEKGLVALEQLQRRLMIPTLAELGATPGLIPQLVAGARGSSMRYNPIELSDGHLAQVIEQAMARSAA